MNMMDDTLVEFYYVFQTLSSDVGIWAEKLFGEATSEIPRGACRRNFVRSAYAFFDGTVYAMKQVAMQRVRDDKVIIEPGEIQMLTEREVFLNEQGKLKERAVRINTIANIRFGMEAYARVHSVACPVSWGDREWGDLQSGIKVRDRLMHPKRAEDLEVSDEECIHILTAVQWFTQSIKKTLAASIVTLVKETPDGEAIVQQLFPEGLPS